MREEQVESYLCREVEKRGGLCEKLTVLGKRGPPDRLITWPKAQMDLVELKRPGAKPRKLQLYDHAQRAKRGIHVFVLDSKNAVNAYIASRSGFWS